MANIQINEISRTYTHVAGNGSFCQVALPITACWGPAFVNPASLEGTDDAEKMRRALEATVWTRFPATAEGLEAFLATFRGPAANYRTTKDTSYHMALTLLSAGYDVLVCRLAPGATAQGQDASKKLTIKAKYPGTFGNNLLIKIKKVNNFAVQPLTPKDNTTRTSWSILVYVVDSVGTKTAVENLSCVFDLDRSNDSVMHISELASQFIEFTTQGLTDAGFAIPEGQDSAEIVLTGGSDLAAPADTAEAAIAAAAEEARKRFVHAGYSSGTEAAYSNAYIEAVGAYKAPDLATANIIAHKEWCYWAATQVYDLLTDRLTYNPGRIISPGWDDQDIQVYTGNKVEKLDVVSPLHIAILKCAANSRCGAGYVDVPRSLTRDGVFNASADVTKEGYAQKLARYLPVDELSTTGALFSSHSGLYAPWGQYKFVDTPRMSVASPSFTALMLEKAMLDNQAAGYEWLQPSSRKHTLNFGTQDYVIPKKILDVWQSGEGVGINVITQLPDTGTTLWGNSTLYELPPASYQALANMSTRKLVNAVEDTIFRVGLTITFSYNNAQAYSSFYAGMTPLLDKMKNAGAIEGYRVSMNADVDATGQIKQNAVLGKIYLAIPGVINQITCDLIALPSGTDLSSL